MYIGLHVKYPSFFVRFQWNLNFLVRFGGKNSQKLNSMKTLPVGTDQVNAGGRAGGRANGRTDSQINTTKLIVALRNFANAPKNQSLYVVQGDNNYVNKSVPLQAWSCSEGSRKLRFPDFMTTAQGDGKVVSHTHRPYLPQGNSPGTHFCQRLSRPQGHGVIGRSLAMKNSNDTNWNRTSGLPICSTAP